MEMQLGCLKLKAPQATLFIESVYAGRRDFHLFQIYKIEEEHNGIEIVTKAYAEHAFFEMNDDIIEDLRTVDGTADSAMTDALSKSRFQKGTVADLGNRTLLSTPDGITFKSINRGEFVFKDKVWIDADADLLQLYGSTHCYIEFFKTGGSRSGWFGYGSLNNDNLNISNSIGRVIINTSDGGVAEFMGLSGHDGLRMSNRAIIKWLSSSDTMQIRSSSD